MRGGKGTMDTLDPSVSTDRFWRRPRAIHRMRERLLRRGMPRLLMSLLLAATGSAGFLFSFLLLQLGFDRMWIRYSLAVGLAYLVFLLLLRLWMGGHRGRPRRRSSPFSRVADGAGAIEGLEGVGHAAEVIGKVPLRTRVHSLEAADSSGFDFDFDFSFDLEGLAGAIVLAMIAVVGAALFASLYVVWAAPTLLAEILVDGVLLAGFYRRLHDPGQPNWMIGAVRRTWVPVLVTALLFAVAGGILQAKYPEARSIGAVWEQFSSNAPR
ncbi:MAG TPA: hypothetical protein VE685_23905 [Thermoanaerobaculia bacterium]|nr:hypothetical protein [Thermoanaerobaculia bacterium]